MYTLVYWYNIVSQYSATSDRSRNGNKTKKLTKDAEIQQGKHHREHSNV